MQLKPFIAKHVNPGEPLTAQAWNDIVDAVDQAYQYLQATLHVVHVQVTATGLDPSTARVTAQRTGSAPIEAVRPIQPDTFHVLAGLEPGDYSVRAEAPGFSPKVSSITVGPGAETDVTIALDANGALMPDLFGLALADARAALGALGINVSRLLDFEGNEMPPQNPGTELASVPVLVQSPEPGTPVPPGSTAKLVIAVPPKIASAVQVPSLAGLTQVEAQKALEGLGLVLGKVRIVSKQGA
jgi:hypothetical protein